MGNRAGSSPVNRIIGSAALEGLVRVVAQAMRPTVGEYRVTACFLLYRKVLSYKVKKLREDAHSRVWKNVAFATALGARVPACAELFLCLKFL